MNRLANEQSAYLRRASNQKIDWHPWSEEAFALARREDKPVFLSTGAAWCHWCHVMADETFEDEEAAGLMNELFINIKLDRDERPEIDRRYQHAVAAMGGGSGWPLSVFLTPDKQAFYGGTYFPPEDRQGIPAFKKVLSSVSEFYRTKRADAAGHSRQVMDSIKTAEPVPSDIGEEMVDQAEKTMLEAFDDRNGGFGTAPKFPMPGALEFLMRRPETDNNGGGRNPDPARRMLDAMAMGGFHDHLGGGFHRYSVDDAWIIPHFEKLADDNAGLLRNYVDGFARFGDHRYRDVAMGIVAFTREVLSDPEGGFYASQDADVTPDDEGGYFTWTEEEFRKPLNAEEYALLSAYYLHERGGMHHNPEKKVIFERETAQQLAERLGMKAGDVRLMIVRAGKKLLAVRAKRQEPFIDRTLYTSLNGMLIGSFFHAFGILGDDEIKTFAARSLERIVRLRFTDRRLYHAGDLPAGLDDFVHLVDALVAGYEATAHRPWLEQAERLMAMCLHSFYDHERGGFFDTEDEVLGTRLKTIEDIPHPSANAVAIGLLLKLDIMTGREEYRRRAEQSLRLFAKPVRELGVHAGAYFCGLDASYRMIKLTVEADPAGGLAAAARSLAGFMYTAIVYGDDRNRVIPCRGRSCYEPVSDPEALRASCLSLQQAK